jgi:thiol:disulfide interchange protein/DsbC/DsbD-like thiol-disulfide interchange protein
VKKAGVAACLLLLSLPLAAAPGQAVRSGPVVAQLISENASVRAGQPFTVGLLLRMDPDWHVYWQNPGDSGLPTTIAWDLPPGFSAGSIQWPIPQRIDTQGLVTYGYSRQVLLLAEITPPAALQAGSSVIIRARAGWLACRIECTPGKAALSLSLPASSAPSAREAGWVSYFAEARRSLPRTDQSVDFSAQAGSGSLVLAASGLALPSDSTATFFPSTPGAVSYASPQEVRLQGASLSIRMARPDRPGAISRLTGVLVISGRGILRGLEVDAPVNASSAGAGATDSLAGFLVALLLAFAGGVLLNFMPCVLPVISLKVLSFVRKGGGGLRHGLSFTAGVLVSFWAIAGILAALRAGGHLLGWGFQFQDPAVVAVTAALFFLIGLNLFGVFEIGASLTRLGSVGAGRSAGASSFLSGLFATAVATPCTAPFMGGALGYALTRPFSTTLGVFTALALGMAGPYLVLSGIPRLASRLPKPGPWMETLRQVMAFPMMGAVVWMLFVLSGLSGPRSVIWLLAGLLVAGLGAWIWGRWGKLDRSRGARIASAAIALALVLAGPGIAIALTRSAAVEGPSAGAAESHSGWEEWSADRVARLRSQGVPVFVDFTARWCLSCQVNEQVALANASVEKRFRDLGVATLKADWTDTNDAIAAALASYGRASVPLYVLYGVGAPEPVFLPELLTPGIVLSALEKLPASVRLNPGWGQ